MGIRFSVLTYEGFYRDGQSSREYPGRIVFEHEHIVVEFVDAHNEGKTAVWHREKVSYSRSHKGVVLLYNEGFEGSFVVAGSGSDIDESLRLFLARKFPWKWGITILCLVIGIVVFFFLGLPVLVEKSVDAWYQRFPLPAPQTNTFSPFFPFAKNMAASARLQAFCDTYLPKTHFPSVVVVRDFSTNAFATIDGHILVTEGMFHVLRTPDKLVALLAHEKGHIKFHHPAKMLVRAQIGSFFLMLLGGGSEWAQILLSGSETLLVYQYSQRFEYMADEYALRYLIQHGWDPQAIENLLMLLPESPSFLPTWASTHPSNEDRIERLQMLRRSLGATYTPTKPNPFMLRDFRRLKDI